MGTTTSAFADRVQETTTTTGTGTITLAGAVTGYQSFDNAFADGTYVYYALTNGSAWEVGYGKFTHSGTTLTRNLISSSTGSLISLSGTSTVWCDQPALSVIGQARAVTGNYTVDTSGPDQQLNIDTTSGSLTVTLPAPVVGRMIFFTTNGTTSPTSTVTFAQHASEKISGVAGNYVFETAWGGGWIQSNGTDWFVVT